MADVTLSVVPEPQSRPPRNRLEVAVAPGLFGQSVTLSRRNPDGRVVPLRGAQDAAMYGQDGIFFDYEAPYNADLTYEGEVTVSDVASPGVVWSEPWGYSGAPKAPWVFTAGQWSVAGASVSPLVTAPAALTRVVSMSNYQVQVPVTVLGRAAKPTLYAWHGGGNWVAARWDAIAKVVELVVKAPAEVVVGSVPLPGLVGTLGLSRYGSRVGLLVDGVEVASAVLSGAQVAALSGSSVGLHAVGGAATVADFGGALTSPTALAFGPDGTLFAVASTKIVKISPAGVQSDLAAVSSPKGLVVDQAGNVYTISGTSTSAKVVKITPAGVVSDLVAYPNAECLAVDRAGNVYVAGSPSTPVRVKKVTPSGVATDFGNANVNVASAMVFDSAGNLYVASSSAVGTPLVAKITPAGVLTSVGQQLRSATAITCDAADNVYVAAAGSINMIYRITPQGVMSDYASVTSPKALAWDLNGVLHAALDTSNKVVKIVGGAAVDVATGISSPVALAADSDGFLYAASSVSSGKVVKLRFGGAAFGAVEVRDAIGIRQIAPVSGRLSTRESWLIHPGTPSLSALLRIKEQADTSRAVNQGVFRPHGRRSPIVITDGRRKSPASAWTVMTFTADERRKLLGILESSSVLLQNISADEGWEDGYAYISVGDVTEHRPSHGRDPMRFFVLPYEVVDRPAGAVRLEWTFQKLLDAHATFQDVLDGYADFLTVLSPTA